MSERIQKFPNRKSVRKDSEFIAINTTQAMFEVLLLLCGTRSKKQAERETEREKEKERQRDRERKRDRETERDREKEEEREREKEIDR